MFGVQITKFVWKVVLILRDVCDSDSKRQGSCLCCHNGQFKATLSQPYFQSNSKSTFSTKLIFKIFQAQYCSSATCRLKANSGELALVGYWKLS